MVNICEQPLIIVISEQAKDADKPGPKWQRSGSFPFELGMHGQ
jgi:hypothetical protein